MPAPSASYRLTLSAGGHEYPVFVGPGQLAAAGETIARQLGVRRCLVAIDANVDAIHGERIRASLQPLSIVPVVVPDGEPSKSLAEVARLAGEAVRAGLGRDAAVITVGGGVVGDLAGFVAAVYMRGVPVVHLPTTLLAMVDSAIGGKTAVNLLEGKNLLGAFHQPSLVIADTDLLATLPAPELAAGFAEAVKLGLACDAGFYQWVAANVRQILSCEPAALSHLVAEAVRLKGAVVADDERDAGTRAALNLGHTVAHALETVTGFARYRHGEAVAIGLVAAARLAEERGTVSGLATPLISLLTTAGLPVRLPPVPVVELIGAMTVDKKQRDSVPRWVLPTAVGSVELGVSVPPDMLRFVLVELGAQA